MSDYQSPDAVISDISVICSCKSKGKIIILILLKVLTAIAGFLKVISIRSAISGGHGDAPKIPINNMQR